MDTRRQFLGALAGVVAAVDYIPGTAHAWSRVSAQDLGLFQASGIWATLERATDGTDPATTQILPPDFNPQIRDLAGSEVTLPGYLTALPDGSGRQGTYLLSREIFHCPTCYPFGRGSLSLAVIDGPAPPHDVRVRVKGTLALREPVPALVYFRLDNGRLL